MPPFKDSFHGRVGQAAGVKGKPLVHGATASEELPQTEL
jgi:hypothetical protein